MELRRHLSIALPGLLLLFIAAALWLWPDGLDRAALQGWLQAHPLSAPLLFILIYAAMVLALLPGGLWCVVGGALFGPLWGLLFNLGGAALGAASAFLLARHLIGDTLERHQGERLQKIQAGVTREGWRFVAIIRLIPIFSYDLFSYLFGLTRIRLATFVLTTALCIAPRVAAYGYLGHTGRQLLSSEQPLWLQGVIAVTLVVAVMLLPHLLRSLRGTPAVQKPRNPR